MVGEAGPRCQSPPPIARSTSVACRTTPRCRAHAGRGIWGPRIHGPRQHDGAVKVRAARRRAPRASEDSNARGRLFGGGPSPSVRAGLRSPLFFYLVAASRLSHAAVRARRRNVSPIGSRGRRRQDVEMTSLHFFALLPALGTDRMNGLLPHWSARSANWLRSVLGRWFSGAISYSSRASLGS